MKKVILVLILIYSCKSPAHGPTHGVQHQYYTCSMDPQIMETKPGKCPICHMDLTPIMIDTVQNTKGIRLSDQQIILANIKTLPSIYEKISETLEANAVLASNEENIQMIVSKLDGRIDKLYYKGDGEYITKDQPLFALYSEVLNSVQEEYIYGYQRFFKNTHDSIARMIYQAAEHRLFQWGVLPNQLHELQKRGKIISPFIFLSRTSGHISEIMATEGSYLMEGDPVYKINDYSSLWVNAAFYPGDELHILPGKVATIEIDAFPDMILNGQIMSSFPQVLPQQKTIIARISIRNKEKLLIPGMQAIVKIPLTAHMSITVKSTAVIKNPNGNIVWVKSNENFFEPRFVKIGIENGEKTEITDGLAVGEEIVISGAYLIQSEFIFKMGKDPKNHFHM